MADISPSLREALEAWLADATSDEPSKLVTRHGICYFMRDNRETEAELKAMFRNEFGLRHSSVFPFNRTLSCLFREGDAGACHVNPERLAWVRKTLSKREKCKPLAWVRKQLTRGQA